MSPKFFKTPSDLRSWFEHNHTKEKELFVGFYKVNSGKSSITWPESVKEALCFGWIDGIRKSLGEDSYMIRFTPRKSDSTWSNVNVKLVQELTKSGLMQPAGLKVFEDRKKEKSGVYGYEQTDVKFNPSFEKKLHANQKAWEYFQARPLSYRKPAVHWVMSAKQEATRRSRLEQLIDYSEQGKSVPPLTPRVGKK